MAPTWLPGHPAEGCSCAHTLAKECPGVTGTARATWSVPRHADQAGLAGEGEQAAGQGHSKHGERVSLPGT